MFFFFLSFFPPPLPTSQFGGDGGIFSFVFLLVGFGFFFPFSTFGNFCILFSLKKRKEKSLNKTKPKEPIFDLGSLAGW